MPEIFQLNATLPVFVASFLVFLYLLNKIMLEPVGRVLEARDAKAKADLEAGKAARAQAAEVLDQYHTHLHEIRAEAQSLINAAVEKSNYDRNTELGRLREHGAKNVESARGAIEDERASLIDALVSQEQELVEGITRKLLGEPVAVGLEVDQVRHALEEAC